MRVFFLAIAVVLSAGPSRPDARISVLMDVLQIGEVVEILQTEGFAQARELNEEFLEGQGGAFWDGQIRQIYDTDQISERVRQALAAGLEADEVEAVIGFYGTEDASRIMKLENAARRALADPVVERAARDTYLALKEGNDQHYLLVQRFIAENDLLERNVSGSMSAYVQFYKGLSDGRLMVQSEAEILTMVWAQEADIRSDTEEWLNGFLLMAYQPLPASLMEAHVAFSETPAGKALNAALFDGFQSVNMDISYALGRAIALNAEGDEI